MAGRDRFDPSRRAWLGRHALAALATPLAVLAPGTAIPAARQAKPVSGNVQASAQDGLIRLDLNESSYGPSPKVAPAVQQALSQAPRYVSAEQGQALAEQIAGLEGVAVEQVIVGEVLEPLGQHLALASSGGSFVYSVPGYGALVDAAAPFGGRAIEVPLDASLNNDLPALLAAITGDTRAVFVVNPHNPSGTISSGPTFDAFVERASRRTLVIVDEAYLDYQPDAASRTAVRLLRQGHNVAVFRTLGKIHALAGLQIGYALVPRTLAAALRQRGVGGSHSLNQLSIAAASATLSDPAHVASVRAQVATERQAWLELLKAEGLRYAEPAGNFVFVDTRRPHAEIASGLLKGGVRIARAFPRYDQWVRITIGTPQENMAAQAALLEVLKSA